MPKNDIQLEIELEKALWVKCMWVTAPSEEWKQICLRCHNRGGERRDLSNDKPCPGQHRMRKDSFHGWTDEMWNRREAEIMRALKEAGHEE